jgi:hypothetical protein
MLIYTMNTRTQFLAVVCATAFCASLHSQTDSSSSSVTQNGSTAKPQKGEVTKLDGTKYFGFVEVTDDYTIRVTNDSGIMRLPIAQLEDNDFRKYGFQKDRGKDGRFWYERKEAIQSTETTPNPTGTNPDAIAKNPDSVAKNPDSDDNSESQSKPIAEIRLSEIAAFQPLIAAYEKTLASKESKKSALPSKPQDKTDTSDVPFRPLFSEPGLGGPLPQPFSLGGSSVSGLQTPVSGGSDIIQSATGAAGLPSPP